MKEAQDCQKSYVYLYRRNLKFKVGDHVFLKISPIREVMKFDKSGKLVKDMQDHFRYGEG